jgi:zinc protease
MKKTLLSAIFPCLSVMTFAQVPANLEKLTSVEGITEYKLKNNGLKVLLFPDASKPTITVNITYLVGSRHEGYGETGMAHLLEHMVFKGSAKHATPSKELKDHGCQYNGSTWLDRTNYYETFAATDENLDWALDLESDRMITSHIAKKDLDSEFSVVRNEFESGENSPTGVLMERVLSTAFIWHNYGKSTIGNRSDIENVPIENLQAFYRKFYQPDNAVLIITGKFDDAKTLKLIDKYFTPIAKPSRVLPQSWTVEPTQDGERNVSLRRTGDVQVVSCGYHVPASSHPDYASVQLLVEVMTNSPSGRLHKELVATNKASSQWGFSFWTKEPGFAYFNVDVRKEQSLDSAKQILLKTFDNLSQTAITEAELKRAKTVLLKQVEEMFRNSETTGTIISEFIGMGDWRLFFILRDAMEKVTVADINRVAAAYFKPSNRTIGTFVPEAKSDRAEIPGVPDLAALVSGYKGKAAIAEGEVFEASPQNIDKRTKKGQIGELKTAFLTKTTRGNTVNAVLNIRYGDLKSLEGKRMTSYMAGRMLMKGTKTLSQQQIKDKLDELKASVRLNGSKDQTSVNIETVRENLPEVLKIITDVLMNPSFPEKEFEEIRQEELAATEQQLKDPQALAFNTLDRHLNPQQKGDIRYVMTPQEEIDALKTVKLADARQFHKDFYGASTGTLTIVGDFDAAAVEKVLQAGLGKFKSPKAHQRLPNDFKEIPAKNEAIKTPDKANAMFVAGTNIKLDENDPDFAAMMVGNNILGGGGLSSRLADRIRQKEGLSYGVGSYVQVDPIVKAGVFGAYAIYAPENVEKLEKAFTEEIEKILKDGITEKELADAKKSMLQARMVGRSDDQQLVGRLDKYLYFNRTMDWDAKLEAAISALTVDSVNKILKKHIDLKKISMVKAGDFDKVKKP